MNKMKRVLCAALALGCLALAGCGRSASPAPLDIQDYTAKTKQTSAFFGTTSTLCLYGDFTDTSAAAAYEDTWRQVKELLERIEAAVAVDMPGSDVARFNALRYGESCRVGADTAKILAEARRVYEDTGGVYDPTVYPLVDLWAFTPRFNSNTYEPEQPYDRPRLEGKIALPDAGYIDAFVKLVDFGGVELTDGGEQGYTLTKNIPPVEVAGVEYQAQLDLGGIAKGYAVDQVMELLRAQGWQYGYFSCGSSSIGMLQSASQAAQADGTYQFSLGVRKPRQTQRQGSAYLSVGVRNASLSSSGDYEHSYEVDGVLYCHIIDPSTGWPVNTPASEGGQQGLATVTLLGGTAAYDDGLTTALCLMGPQKALDYLNERLPGYQAAFVIYRAGSDTYELVTNLPEGQYTVQDDAYQLAGEVDSQGRLVYTGSLLGE